MMKFYITKSCEETYEAYNITISTSEREEKILEIPHIKKPRV